MNTEEKINEVQPFDSLIDSVLSETIILEIIRDTDVWKVSAEQLDTSKCKNFWINSDQLRYAEGGKIFPSYDSIVSFCQETIRNSKVFNMEWIKREVHPLTHNIACFTGIFKFSIEFKDGNKWAGTNIITATMVKQDNIWKVINGHEASKQD